MHYVRQLVFCTFTALTIFTGSYNNYHINNSEDILNYVYVYVHQIYNLNIQFLISSRISRIRLLVKNGIGRSCSAVWTMVHRAL